MKKLLSLLLTIMIVVSSSITVFAEDVVNENNQVEEVQDTNSNNNEIVEENNDDILNENTEDDSTIENNDSNLFNLPLLTATQNTNEYRNSGTCGDNINWTLDYEGNLVLSGTGDMTDYQNTSEQPWIEEIQNINTLVISEGITSIGAFAFSNLQIEEVSLPAGITNIGEYAFFNCIKLRNVSIPSSLNSVGLFAFNQDGKLEYYEDNSCKYLGNEDNHYVYLSSFSDINATSFNIPETTKVIGEYAFSNKSNLKSVAVPDGVTCIGSHAFYKSGIESISLNSINGGIGSSAFQDCESLKTVTINGGLSAISSWSFAYLHLNTINLPASVTKIEQSAFQSTTIKKVIYSGTLEQFNEIEIGNSNFDLKSVLFFNKGVLSGSCGTNASYVLDEDGVLTISGSGTIKDTVIIGRSYNAMNKIDEQTKFMSWFDSRENIKKVVIESGITKIGNFAFLDCQNIEEVVLPSSLESIGYYAFYNNSKLATINTEGVKTVKNFAFFGCPLLKDNLDLSSLTSSDIYAFYYDGENASAQTFVTDSLNRIVDYLNKEYLRNEATIGLDLFNMTEEDKLILTRIATDVTEGCDTDAEKVDAIGNYVSELLDYNIELNDYVGDILKHLGGVCRGHNQFTASLLKIIGIKCAVVDGKKYFNKLSDVKEAKNHAVVFAYYDSNWHIVDTTTNYTNNPLTLISENNYMYLDDVDGVNIYDEKSNPFFDTYISHEGTIYWIDGSYTIDLSICGFVFSTNYGSDLIINNDFYRTSKKVLKNTYIDYYNNEITNIDNSIFYTGIKNNGLEMINCNYKIGNDYYYFGEFSGIKTSKELSYLANYGQGKYYILKGTKVSLLNSDLLSLDKSVSITSSNTDVIDIDIHGNVVAKDVGETSVMVYQKNKSSIYIGFKVIDSISDIITNETVKQYCDHEYSYRIYSDILAANKESNGSYTFIDYCKYCGKQIDSGTCTTYKIDSIVLDTTTFDFDGEKHYPSVTIKDSEDNTLKEYVDYIVEYDNNPVLSGEYNVKVVFMNGYSGTENLKYTIQNNSYSGDWGNYNQTNKTLTISSTIQKIDFEDSKSRPWDLYKEDIKIVVLPNSLSRIGKNMFSTLSSIEEIAIPSSVTTIANGAFENCNNLTTISIDNSLSSIGDNAFSNCSNLSKILFNGTINKWNLITISSTGNSALASNKIEHTQGDGSVTWSGSAGDNCNFILTEDGILTINGTGILTKDFYSSAYRDSIVKVVVNNGITNITGKFNSFSSLTSVYLSNSIKSLGDGCFYNCGKLENILLPNQLESIGDDAFYNCKKLQSITVPNSVTSIGEYAFSSCEILSSVTLSNNLKRIEKSTFQACLGLENIVIPNGVEYIAEQAFIVSGLKGIEIPSSVKTIGDGAFAQCNNLKFVIFPSSLEKIGTQLFSYASSMKYVFVSKDIDTLTIDNNNNGPFTSDINRISVFVDCSKEDIPWETNWNKGSSAGGLCNTYYGISLDEFNLVVEEAAYTINYNLESGSGDFASQTKKYIIDGDLISNSIPTRTDYEFLGWRVGENGNTIIQAGSKVLSSYWLTNNNKVELYAVWQKEAEDKILEQGSCGDSATYTIRKNKILTISGSGSVTKDFSNYSLPIEHVVIEEGITSSRNLSNNASIKSIIFPDSLTSVGKLDGCSNLTDITFPISASWGLYESGNKITGTTNIKNYIITKGTGVGINYQNSSGMPWVVGSSAAETIAIKEGVTSIGNCMFRSCKFDDDFVMTLPSSLDKICVLAFNDCEINELVLPEGLTEICDNAFVGSTIKKLTIPSTLQTIGESWLSRCSNLKSAGPIGSDCDIVFGWEEEIPDKAFANLASLTSVTIPNTTTRIGKDAFLSTSIKNLVVPDSVSLIDQRAFNNIEDLETLSIPISCEITKGMINTYKAFYNCSGLTSVTYTKGTGNGIDILSGDSINIYPWITNSNCSIDFDDGIKSIGNYQFYEISCQPDIVLPDSIEKIGKYAFSWCPNLKNIKMPINASVKDNSFYASGIEAVEFTKGSISEGDKIQWPPIVIPSEVLAALQANRPVKLEYEQKTIEDNNLDPAIVDGFEVNRDSCLLHGMYFEVGFEFDIDGTKKQINELDENVDINISLPTNLIANENTTRVYYVMREHNGEYTKLPVSVSEQGNEEIITFKSDKFSTFELVYVDISNKANLYSASLTLADDIKINMFINITDQIVNDNGSYVLIKNIDKNTSNKVYVKDLEKNNNGHYKVTASVVPKELNTTINVQVFDSSNNPVSENMTYSASEYLYQVVDNPDLFEEELIDVCKKIIDLGTVSQLNFKFQTNKLLNEETDIIIDSLQDISASSLDSYSYSQSGEVAGITVLSAKISLETQTICSITYKLQEGYSADNFIYKIDGETVNPVVEGNKVIIKYASVAKNLGNKRTVSVSDGTDTYSIDFCALSYVYQVLDTNGIANSVNNVCKALYKYYLAANTYFNR